MSAAFEQMKKTLGKEHACYVLITCTDCSENGEMDVQMDFEGDENLAAFLVDSASQIFDSRRESK